MSRHSKSATTPAAYAALMARLLATQEAIVAQGKSRPALEAPEKSVRIIRRLLTDLRRFAARLGSARAIPALSHGPLPFSTLIVVLAEAHARFETLGFEHALPQIDPRSVQGQIAVATRDMAALLSAGTTRFRKARQARLAYEDSTYETDRPQDR